MAWFVWRKLSENHTMWSHNGITLCDSWQWFVWFLLFRSFYHTNHTNHVICNMALTAPASRQQITQCVCTLCDSWQWFCVIFVIFTSLFGVILDSDFVWFWTSHEMWLHKSRQNHCQESHKSQSWEFRWELFVTLKQFINLEIYNESHKQFPTKFSRLTVK